MFTICFYCSLVDNIKLKFPLHTMFFMLCFLLILFMTFDNFVTCYYSYWFYNPIEMKLYLILTVQLICHEKTFNEFTSRNEWQ